MQVITDLKDRALYARLRTDAELRCNGNCNQGRMCDCTPDIDDEGDRSGDLPEGAGIIIAASIVGAIAALAMFAHWFAGVLL